MKKEAIIFFVFFVLAGIVSATNYYVSNSGSDSNDGLSITTPFQTVHKGVSMAFAGDTVYIRNGTYDEIDSRNTCADSKNCGTLYAIRSGTYNSPITFRGYPGDVLPVIKGDPNRYAIYISSGYANLIYDSLEVTNGYRGITVGNVENLTIRNSNIHDLSGVTGNNNNGGIFFIFTYSTIPGLRNVLIENNHIHHNKDTSCFVGTGAGIEMYGAYNVTIRNNTIHDEYGGVFAKGNLWVEDPPGTMNWESLNFVNIYNNTIYNVDQGIYFHGSNNVKVYDNLVFNFSFMGIGQSAASNLLYPDHENFSWYQNTVVGTGNYTPGHGVCFFYKNTTNTNVYNNILTNCDYRASTTSCNAASPYDDFQREFANKGAGSDYDGTQNLPDYAVNFKENNNIIYNSLGNYNFCWYFIPYNLTGWRSYWQTQGSNNGQYSISADPLFFNQNNYNYHLQNISPGVDNGTFIPGFHCALSDGNGGASLTNCRHWSGSAPDIGAYEYTSGASSRECPSNWQTLHPDWIFCDDFENGNLTKWDPTGAKNTINSNSQNVLEGNYSLQQMLNTNGDGGNVLETWFLPGYDEIYVRAYVKFQPGFQNLRTDGNGMHLLGIAGNVPYGNSGTVPTGYDRFTTGFDPDHTDNSGVLMPLTFYSYFPEMSGNWGNVFRQTAPQTPLVGGQWQLVEARVRVNTVGLHDGLQELYVNNTLKISVQNMRWRDTTDLKLNVIVLFAYMPNTIGTQYIYFDNIVVSRSPIGPLGSTTLTSNSPDVNSDGLINIKDLSIVIFNQGRTPTGNYAHLDLNNDTLINWNDVQIVMGNI
jgi:parallel beta-helix repeat protein